MGALSLARGGGREGGRGKRGTPGWSPGRGRRVPPAAPPRPPDCRAADCWSWKSDLAPTHTAPRRASAALGNRHPVPRLQPEPHPCTHRRLRACCFSFQSQAAGLLPTPLRSAPQLPPYLPPASKAGALGQVPVRSLLSSPRENFSEIFPESCRQGPEFPPLHLPSGCLQTSLASSPS